MSFKKEDQEYIDSEINKQEETNDLDYYKKQHKSFFILSFAGILLSAVLSALFSTIGGEINFLILLLIIGIFTISASYIVLASILEIISLFFIKLKEDYKTKFTIQMVISSVIVILVLIFVILGNTFNMAGNLNPATATKQLLRQQINYPGSLICTDTVRFSKEKLTLSSQEISNNSGLDYSQVYFDNPEHLPNFDVSNRSVLKYTSTSNKNVVMCIICSNNGKLELQEALIQNEINTIIDSNIEGETLCLVYPKKAV